MAAPFPGWAAAEAVSLPPMRPQTVIQQVAGPVPEKQWVVELEASSIGFLETMGIF